MTAPDGFWGYSPVTVGPWPHSTVDPLYGPPVPVWPGEHELFAHLMVDHDLAPHGLDHCRLYPELVAEHDALHNVMRDLTTPG